MLGCPRICSQKYLDKSQLGLCGSKVLHGQLWALAQEKPINRNTNRKHKLDWFLACGWNHPGSAPIGQWPDYTWSTGPSIYDLWLGSQCSRLFRGGLLFLHVESAYGSLDIDFLKLIISVLYWFCIDCVLIFILYYDSVTSLHKCWWCCYPSDPYI